MWRAPVPGWRHVGHVGHVGHAAGHVRGGGAAGTERLQRLVHSVVHRWRRVVGVLLKILCQNIKFSNTFKNVFKIFAASHLLRCDVTDAVRCVLDTRGGFHRGEVILLFRVHEHLLYLPLHRAPRLLERLSPLDVCRLAALLQPPHGDSCGLLLRRGG